MNRQRTNTNTPKTSQLAAKLAAQLALIATVTTALLPGTAFAQITSGDETTACAVILCLSSPQRPSECRPPIQKYFSIQLTKPWDTVTARRNFLKLCPSSNDQHIDFIMDSTTFNEVGTTITRTELKNYKRIQEQARNMETSDDTYEQSLANNLKPRLLEIELYLERQRIDPQIAQLRERLAIAPNSSPWGKTKKQLQAEIDQIINDFENKYGIKY